MKIQLVSDLHLEFAPIQIENEDNADILVLSGDILVAERFTRTEASPYFQQALEWKQWFEYLSLQYDHIFYVLGNHEHYHGRIHETVDILLGALGHIPNLSILDSEIEDYEGFTIVGGTLWTDFDKSLAKAEAVRNGLNDYRLIERPGYSKLRPEDTLDQHYIMLNVIRNACRRGKPVLVFGHHGPSYQSVPREYYGSNINAGYVSHLDEFILAHPQIHLWTHGHTHSSHRYKIGNTLIVCNPRGYAHPNREGQENERFTPNYYINI